MLSTSKIEEVSQICFVFDVAKFKNWYTTLIIPHHNYNRNCDYTTLINCTALQLQLRYTTPTTTATTALRRTTSSSCGPLQPLQKHNSNHLSAHQWIRSAIRDSQQPTSPKGFLFLKFPPPPCAALRVITEQCRRCFGLWRYSPSWTPAFPLLLFFVVLCVLVRTRDPPCTFSTSFVRSRLDLSPDWHRRPCDWWQAKKSETVLGLWAYKGLHHRRKFSRTCGILGMFDSSAKRPQSHNLRLDDNVEVFASNVQNDLKQVRSSVSDCPYFHTYPYMYIWTHVFICRRIFLILSDIDIPIHSWHKGEFRCVQRVENRSCSA